MRAADAGGMLDSVQRRSHLDACTFLDGPDEGSTGGGGSVRAAAPGRALPEPAATQGQDAFYASLRANASAAAGGATSARDERVGQKLDALRAAYAGPYQAEGQTVSAPAMFRMNGGFSDASAKLHGNEVEALAKRAGVSAYGALHGIATPSQLTKITQALIDAGRLPPGPGDLGARIKAMQWEYGIGIDCACYTRMALAAATGKSEQLGLLPLGTEGFRNLDRNPSFAKTVPAHARPGDIMTLDDPDGNAGHNVIVRSRTTLDDAAKKALVAEWGASAGALLAGPGPFHAIEVDSSWGAGPDGATTGGVRRDTWYYDEGSKMWGSVDMHAAPPRFQIGVGPAGETFHGAYRAKVEG